MRIETIPEMKIRFLKLALTKAEGNQSKAAILLGITDRTVRAMMRDNNISAEAYKKKGSN